MEQILVTLLVQAPHGGELGLGLRRPAQALVDLRQAVVRVGSRGIQPHRRAEFPGSGRILLVPGMDNPQIQVDDTYLEIQVAGFFEEAARACRIVAM